MEDQPAVGDRLVCQDSLFGLRITYLRADLITPLV